MITTGQVNSAQATPLPVSQSAQGTEWTFAQRHLGPDETQIDQMLVTVERESLDLLIDEAVPPAIRQQSPSKLPEALGEALALEELRAILKANSVRPTYIGMGYHNTRTPAVIQRNILENPGWYTSYTPYQAEIAQGRLEALLNYQTMIVSLTGMEIANSSLLDEATAAAEAMAMSWSSTGQNRMVYLVSENTHPQTLAVLQTRAEPLGIELRILPEDQLSADAAAFGALLQYPGTDGNARDWTDFIGTCHEHKMLVTVAADPLALVLMKTPGAMGADICVGTTQRFGVPPGYGGPHAAFFATRDSFKRVMPGRLVGVSKDALGRVAYRLSLQTREQHIRREKATSNICTAQVLLAVMAGMYAVYHGPRGLRGIASRVHALTSQLAASLKAAGHSVLNDVWFDTLTIQPGDSEAVRKRADAARINLRWYPDGRVSVSLDETVEDLRAIAALFDAPVIAAKPVLTETNPLFRKEPLLEAPIFEKYHTETGFQRYVRRLESRDLSLTTSMIPLGSCTMKLNAATEMLPVTWPEVNSLHPFVPVEQAAGYAVLCRQLEDWLSAITGFAAISLQPNAGSNGEYAGLLAIRRYHRSRGDLHRDVCLIPTSAHGTNPASAVMSGLRVVAVACDADGNVDLSDLKAKLAAHEGRVAALMVTYPSTHGVFEDTIITIAGLVHAAGGMVYMDGANLNALVGLCRPGEFGVDVCHLNLHKTFCIPHGGGGPGVGPIGVVECLRPFLPGHPLEQGSGAVTAAPIGSASILVISWLYIRMMGGEALTRATKLAILSANYIAARLRPFYKILYTGKTGLVAHECILDLREWKSAAGIEVEDVAKRLMDYGFHSPTMSWPVAGTLMVEPTESEALDELDRFCEAMIRIHGEMQAVRNGEADSHDNVLKNAPHPHLAVCADDWEHPYSREAAAYPADWLRDFKFWPAVARIDNVHGDRNLMCLCPTVEEMAEA